LVEEALNSKPVQRNKKGSVDGRNHLWKIRRERSKQFFLEGGQNLPPNFLVLKVGGSRPRGEGKTATEGGKERITSSGGLLNYFAMQTKKSSNQPWEESPQEG